MNEASFRTKSFGRPLLQQEGQGFVHFVFRPSGKSNEARRVRGKRGRGAGGKTIVFGLFKRGGQVYTEIVPDYAKETLQAIIRGKIDVSAMVNTDGWRGYDGLVDVGFDRHFRVRHGQDEFV